MFKTNPAVHLKQNGLKRFPHLSIKLCHFVHNNGNFTNSYLVCLKLQLIELWLKICGCVVHFIFYSTIILFQAVEWFSLFHFLFLFTLYLVIDVLWLICFELFLYWCEYLDGHLLSDDEHNVSTVSAPQNVEDNQIVNSLTPEKVSLIFTSKDAFHHLLKFFDLVFIAYHRL